MSTGRNAPRGVTKRAIAALMFWKKDSSADGVADSAGTAGTEPAVGSAGTSTVSDAPVVEPTDSAVSDAPVRAVETAEPPAAAVAVDAADVEADRAAPADVTSAQTTEVAPADATPTETTASADATPVEVTAATPADAKPVEVTPAKATEAAPVEAKPAEVTSADAAPAAAPADSAESAAPAAAIEKAEIASTDSSVPATEPASDTPEVAAPSTPVASAAEADNAPSDATAPAPTATPQAEPTPPAAVEPATAPAKKAAPRKKAAAKTADPSAPAKKTAAKAATKAPAKKAPAKKTAAAKSTTPRETAAPKVEERTLTARRLADNTYRDEQLAARYEGPIAPFNHLVDRLTEETGEPIPHLAPIYGGTEARVLSLFRDPGPKTRSGQQSSGLLSLENDDQAAERYLEFFRTSGLRIGDLITWNAYPWYTSRKPSTADIDRGIAPLEQVIALLPKLKVVLAHGLDAQAAWRRFERQHPEVASKLVVIPTYHTSKQALFTQDEAVRAQREDKLRSDFAKAAEHLAE